MAITNLYKGVAEVSSIVVVAYLCLLVCATPVSWIESGGFRLLNNTEVVQAALFTALVGIPFVLHRVVCSRLQTVWEWANAGLVCFVLWFAAPAIGKEMRREPLEIATTLIFAVSLTLATLMYIRHRQARLAAT